MEDSSGNLNASIITTPQWSRARLLNIIPYMAKPRSERNLLLGKRLERARRAIGGTQKAFAAKAGIKATTYNQYENGASYPPPDEAKKIAKEHGLTLDYIYDAKTDRLQSWLADAIKALEVADAAQQPKMKVVEPRPRSRKSA